jgi:hypothetical protein
VPDLTVNANARRTTAGRTNRSLRAMVAGVSLTLGVCGASAQVAQLQPNVIRAVTLGSSDRAQIARYVERYVTGLMSDDRTAVVDARDALSEPLTDAEVSVAFRQAYSEALAEPIAELAGSDETWRRFVGLRLAGDVATENSVGVILDAMDADIPEVRFFSMFAAETLFDASAGSASAITDRSLLNLTERLGRVVATSDDARIVDSAVRALQAAIAVPEARVEGVGANAVSVLSRSASELALRLPALDADEVTVLPLLRAGLAIRDRIALAGSDVSRETAMEAIGLGGDLIAFVFQRAEAQDTEDLGGRINVQLANIGAALAFFGDQKRAQATNSPEVIELIDLATPLREGDVSTFRTRVLRLIGDSGLLRREPISMPGERFERSI